MDLRDQIYFEGESVEQLKASVHRAVDHYLEVCAARGEEPTYVRIGVYSHMVIKETSIFTKQVQKLLDRESYRLLQLRLVAEPDAGDLIRGTSGLRKIRWEGAGRGKRGGVRVIYFWARKQGVMLMLLIYGKNEQDDLTPKQKAVLNKLIQEEYP